MLLTFIKMQLHFFKSFQMKPILCRPVPPYARENAYKQMFGLSITYIQLYYKIGLLSG